MDDLGRASRNAPRAREASQGKALTGARRGPTRPRRGAQRQCGLALDELRRQPLGAGAVRLREGTPSATREDGFPSLLPARVWATQQPGVGATFSTLQPVANHNLYDVAPPRGSFGLNASLSILTRVALRRGPFPRLSRSGAVQRAGSTFALLRRNRHHRRDGVRLYRRGLVAAGGVRPLRRTRHDRDRWNPDSDDGERLRLARRNK